MTLPEPRETDRITLDQPFAYRLGDAVYVGVWVNCTRSRSLWQWMTGKRPESFSRVYYAAGVVCMQIFHTGHWWLNDMLQSHCIKHRQKIFTDLGIDLQRKGTAP